MQSSFVITESSFPLGSSFSVVDFNVEEDRFDNWPMVYILKNEREAYVGQTTSVLRRMNQHNANESKKGFDRVNIIFSPEFNMSAVTDYESRLIQLMHADGQYVLTNKNIGISNSNYFYRDHYRDLFVELWDILRDKGVVQGAIEDLEDSEIFKYSPFKSLTQDQEEALERILERIKMRILDEDTSPIVVQGMPGTGKTVLATYLLKMLKDKSVSKESEDASFNGLNSKLVVASMPLRMSLQSAFSRTMNLSKKDVIGPADLVKPEFGYVPEKKGNFDVLLVDEAHLLHRRKNIVSYESFDNVNRQLGLDKNATELDWVLDQAKLPILFYDPMQVKGPSGISPDVAREKLGKDFDYPVELISQMRVKGGKKYLDYIVNILFDKNPEFIDFSSSSENPYIFELVEDFAEFDKLFDRTWKKHSLTREVAGFAWPWATKGNKSGYDIEIDGVKKRWNVINANWVGKGLDNPKIAHEVGWIHSIQGYDLSYAFVILGPDIKYDKIEQRIFIDKDSYFDRNGKNTATKEELEQYIRNIYYVLLTRGMYGTYLYVCDPSLREHLKRFVRVR